MNIPLFYAIFSSIVLGVPIVVELTLFIFLFVVWELSRQM
jgi:hypothetical protein